MSVHGRDCLLTFYFFSSLLLLLYQVIEGGSPEMRVLECVPDGSEGISKAKLEAALGSDLVKVRIV